jgi:hypothetical protein
MHTVHCIKCQVAYESSDPDDYYCPVHLEEKKAIAKKLDAVMGNRPRKPVESELAKYDRLRGKSGYPNAKSLGI